MVRGIGFDRLLQQGPSTNRLEMFPEVRPIGTLPPRQPTGRKSSLVRKIALSYLVLIRYEQNKLFRGKSKACSALVGRGRFELPTMRPRKGFPRVRRTFSLGGFP